mmetsp:Transcript_27560/g.37910  ORF Transcript_27560/g.37910 Transcript_27560/m.37910 type:complete len:1829 (-) Transcript_27560:78-5564(-)
MKDDANLVCPLSYEDPFSIWSILPLQKELTDLRDVTWKSPISSSYITIDKLPLRFLRSDANLFKDTQHSFRWFLAAYVSVYLLAADSLDSYKLAKPNLKIWVENLVLHKRCPWLIIYCPTVLKNTSSDVFNKIYARLCNDFYVERPGDHSMMLITLPAGDSQSDSYQSKLKGNNRIFGSPESSYSSSLMFSLHSPFSSSSTIVGEDNFSQLRTTSFQDLQSKLRERIVQTFQQRTAAYDADIRRLDSTKNSPNFDFRSCFLVKESLALMYQMMQLPEKALGQYEELESLIQLAENSYVSSSAGNTSSPPQHNKTAKPSLNYLPDGDWPMTSPEMLISSDLPSNNGNSKLQKVSDVLSPPGANSADSNPQTAVVQGRERDGSVMNDACKNGDEIMTYSINVARLKILKNKMTALELHRYVFARQMHLLNQLEKPVACAEKALHFMNFACSRIEAKMRVKYLEKSKDSVDDGDKSASTYDLRMAQSNLWALCSAVKLLRTCREVSLKQPRAFDPVANAAGDSMSSSASSFASSATALAAASAALESPQKLSHVKSVINLNGSSPFGGISHNDANNKAPQDIADPVAALSVLRDSSTTIKDTTRLFSDLLQFAISKFNSICPSVTIDCKRFLSSLVIESAVEETNSSWESIDLLQWNDKSETARLETPTNTRNSPEFRAYLDNDLTASGLNRDSIDQILSAVAHKVRSLSHFWAKLRTPTGSSSLFKTPVDVSQEPGKTSLSRFEKGKALELSLIILLLSIQSEFHQTSERHRFSFIAAVKYADFMTYAGLYSRAALAFEKILETSWCGAQMNKDNNTFAKLEYDNSEVDMSQPIIAVMKIVATAETSQLELANMRKPGYQHHVRNFIFKQRVPEWDELRLWITCKLVYCARHGSDWDNYRVHAASLLIILQSVNRRSLTPFLSIPSLHTDRANSMASFLLNELVYLSTHQAVTSSVDARFFNPLHIKVAEPMQSDKMLSLSNIPLNGDVAQLVGDEAKVSLLVLPLQCYFDFTINCVSDCGVGAEESKHNNNKEYSDGFRFKGSIQLHDNIYKINALRFEGGSQCRMVIHLTSFLPRNFEVDHFVVTYSSVLNRYQSSESSAISPSSWFVICLPIEHTKLVVHPGVQSIPLMFTPPAVGDYILDRITMSTAALSFVFQQNVISFENGRMNIPLSCDETMPTFSEPVNPHITDNQSAYNQLRGHHHLKVQSFLHSYDVLQIVSPCNPLNASMILPTFTPIECEDDVLVSLTTHPSDELCDLRIEFTSTKLGDSDLSALAADSNNYHAAVNFLRHKMVLFRDNSAQLKEKSLISEGPDDSDIKEYLYTSSSSDIGISNGGKIRGKLEFDAAASSSTKDITVKFQGLRMDFGTTSDSVVVANSLSNTLDGRNSATYLVPDLLPGNVIHLRLAFTATKCSGSRSHEDEDGDSLDAGFTAIARLRGRLRRNGCWVDLDVSASCAIRCGDVLATSIDAIALNELNVARERYLQVTLTNIVELPLRLVGYSFAFCREPSQNSVGNSTSASMLVLEGPPGLLDLAADEIHAVAKIEDWNSYVALPPQADEDYFAAFRIREGDTECAASSYDLLMYYDFFDTAQRNCDGIHKKVSQRLFSTRMSVPVSQAPSNDSNKLEFVSLGVRKDEFPPFLTLGSPFVFLYSLILRLHRTSISANSSVSGSAEIRWQSLETQPTLDNSFVVNCCNQRVVSVDVCETSSFIVVGTQRQLISSKPLRAWKNGAPSSEAGTLRDIVVPLGQQFVEVEFTLHICLTPLCTGELSLPPLCLTVSPSEQSICFPNQPLGGVMSVLSVDSIADETFGNDCNRRLTQFVHLFSS